MPIDYDKLEDAAYSDLSSGADAQLILGYSQAVSLKRIADVLSAEGIKGLLDIIANHPMNQYGESFSDAIQGAHARGLRGIDPHA